MSASAMHCALDIAADHPAFAGHFPQFPVLPGALLLDETLRIIAHARALDLTHWQIVSAKFLGAIRPGDALCLQHDAATDGVLRFTIRVSNRTLVSGVLSRVAR